MVGEATETTTPIDPTAIDAAPMRLLEGDALDALVQPQCSLSVQLRRATGSIVGRTGELTAIEQGLREAKGRFVALTLEGEPGIGKTRLLVEAAELATVAGFVAVAITADEEIRGPFLVARSLFANGAIREAAVATRAEFAVRRVVDALSGRDGAAPPPGARRAGRGPVGGRDARPVRGRSVHRRGAGPDASGGGHAAA